MSQFGRIEPIDWSKAHGAAARDAGALLTPGGPGCSVLDIEVRRPEWTGSTTVRKLFAALRARGVEPHAHWSAADEAVAASLISGVMHARRGASRREERELDAVGFGVGAMAGTYRFGVAEGVYPRDDGTQDSDEHRLGTYGDIAADIADMGGDTLRRVEACDVYWGCLFPNPNPDPKVLNPNGSYAAGKPIWDNGAVVPPPSEILQNIRVDPTTGLGYGRLAFCAQLLHKCLFLGLKVNLTPFNRGGGDKLNWGVSKPTATLTASAATSPFRTSAHPGGPYTTSWGDVRAGQPSWQSGMLIPGTDGWDPLYWDYWDPAYAFPAAASADATSAAQHHELYAVNVWPTGDTVAGDGSYPSDATAYREECARRKSLAIAAFATGIGEWLAQFHLALGDLGIGLEVYHVVAAIELGNELNGFWPTGSPVTDAGSTSHVIAQGAAEAGRYCALIAGPIRNLLPKMRFRVAELASWHKDDAGEDDFAEGVSWLGAVVQAMDTEIGWWREIQTAAVPGAAVRAWTAACTLAGFSWPPASPLGIDTLGLTAADLVHELGYHWYHGSDHNETGTFQDNTSGNYRLYADAARQARDIHTFRDGLRAVCDPLGITFDITLGEIGFPAVDPNPSGSTTAALGSGYCADTTTIFQASMVVRTLAVNVASGVASSSWFTFCEPLDTGTSGSYSNWGPTSGCSLHNELRAGNNFQQDPDCWQRPAWFAFGRLKALINDSDAVRILENGEGLTVIRFELVAGTHGDWTYAYLFWVDQYFAPTSGLASEVEVTFASESLSEFEYYSVVPLVDETLISTTDAQHYPHPTGDSLLWEWAGFHAAVLDEARIGFKLEFLVRTADPVKAPAPICIFTNAEYVHPTSNGASLGKPVDTPLTAAPRLGKMTNDPRDPGPFTPGPTIGPLGPADPQHPAWLDSDDDQEAWDDDGDAEDIDEATQEES